MIEKWALAIRTHEGWGKNTRSRRNNNPGNCKYNKSGYRAIYGNVGRDEANFAIFPTYELGWLYLCNKLRNACTKRSAYYNPEMTLLEFFKAYCENDPLTPEDDALVYAKEVAQALGVEMSVQIKNLL